MKLKSQLFKGTPKINYLYPPSLLQALKNLAIKWKIPEQKCEIFFCGLYSSENADSDQSLYVGLDTAVKSNLTFSDCIFEFIFWAKIRKSKNNFYFLIGVSNLTEFLHLYVKLAAESNH